MSFANGTAGALKAYRQVAVQTGVWEASPHRLIQMLMEAALQKIAAAKGFLAHKKIAEKGQQISLAIAIIEGLRTSLDISKGGEIAANLDSLYEYMERRLTEANLQNDAAALNEVASLIREIKSAWDAIPENVQVQHQMRPPEGGQAAGSGGA